MVTGIIDNSFISRNSANIGVCGVLRTAASDGGYEYDADTTEYTTSYDDVVVTDIINYLVVVTRDTPTECRNRFTTTVDCSLYQFVIECITHKRVDTIIF